MTMSNATEVGTAVIAVGDRNAVLEMWAESIIEMHRFGCDADRVLARWDEDDVDALMPSSDELDALGFDIVALAKALEAGLNPTLFGEAYHLVHIGEFNRALLALALGFDISLYNEGLERLADWVDESA